MRSLNAYKRSPYPLRNWGIPYWVGGNGIIQDRVIIIQRPKEKLSTYYLIGETERRENDNESRGKDRLISSRREVNYCYGASVFLRIHRGNEREQGGEEMQCKYDNFRVFPFDFSGKWNFLTDGTAM